MGTAYEAVKHWVAERLRAWYGRAAGPVLLAISSVPSAWGWKVLLVGAGAIFVGSADQAVSRQAKRERTSLREEIVNAYRANVNLRLIDAVDMLEAHHKNAAGRFRANVMLVDPDERSAMIAYQSRGYSPQELVLEWRRGEGAAGKAWEEARTIEAPLNGQVLDGTDPAFDAWNVPVAHRPVLGGVAMILSIPLFDEADAERVIGVISLDDTLPPGREHRVIVASFKKVAEKVEKMLHEVRRTLKSLDG